MVQPLKYKLLDSTQEPTERHHEHSLNTTTTTESPQTDSESAEYSALDVRLHLSDSPSPAVLPPDDTQMEPQYELQQEEISSDDKQNNDGDARKLFAIESVRTCFYRRVYGTLACQMLVMAALVAVFLYEPPVKQWVQAVTTDHPIIWAVPITPVVSCFVALVFASDAWHSAPVNYIFLVITTLTKSFLLGFISCYYDTLSIFMTLTLTGVVCLIQTCYGKRTGYGIFTSFAVVPLISYCIFWQHLLSEEPDQVTALVWASFSPFIFAFVLAYAMRDIISDNSNSIWPHEYIFAALHFDWNFIELVLLIIALVMYVSFALLNEMIFKTCCGDEEKPDESQSEDIEKGVPPAPIYSDFQNAEEMVFLSRCEGENEEVSRPRNVDKDLLSTHAYSDPHTPNEMLFKSRCEDEENQDASHSRVVEKDLISIHVTSDPHNAEEIICIYRCDEKNKDMDQSEDAQRSLVSVNSVPHDTECSNEKQSKASPNTSADVAHVRL